MRELRPAARARQATGRVLFAAGLRMNPSPAPTRPGAYELWWRVAELVPGHFMATVLAVPTAPAAECPDFIDVLFAASRDATEGKCEALRSKLHARLQEEGHSVRATREV